MRPAAKVAMSGICTALSVLLLFFGGVVPVLAYVCPMLTGVLMVVLVRTSVTAQRGSPMCLRGCSASFWCRTRSVC